MKHTTMALLTVAFGTLFLAGCQESDATQIRKARVIADENIQLKKQLAEKDARIQDLKKQIEKIETERAKAEEKFGDSTIKTLKMMMETDRKNQALTEENERLKKEIASLKAR